MPNIWINDMGRVLVEDFDEKEFTDAIGDMYLLEVLYRGRGDTVNADRLMNIRVRLKHSVGIESKFKEEENQ